MAHFSLPYPRLERRKHGEQRFYCDPVLSTYGIVFAFTERTGGMSEAPYASLNLGAHVGDDASVVLANRRAVFASVFGEYGKNVEAFHTPEQVHGDHIALVRSTHDQDDQSFSADALMTDDPTQALLLCFADCVPVILAAPKPAVCVVHAGWKGALLSLPGKAASALAELAGCTPRDINAYVGPHICAKCYESSEEIIERFATRFNQNCRAGTRNLDLSTAVSASLQEQGVDPKRISKLGICTAESTDRFFSYRAEKGVTGRHGALAMLTKPPQAAHSHLVSYS